MTDDIMATKALTYRYEDGTLALKGVSLNIPRGKTTAVLGSNGAGKSTLFLHLNGILQPASGEVYYEGRTLTYSRAEKKQLLQSVGLVFQDPDHQLFSASVFQDVSFGPMNLKLPQEVVRHRVLTALEKTGMLDCRDKSTHSLSYGQKKRVALAGVLAMEPQVLVLDEPTAGLDPMAASSLMKLLKNMERDLNMSVVIATHDIDMVPLYCDQVYVLNQGQVVLEGTPQQVFSRPEELRQINLRLPRIGHLMEVLKKKDGIEMDGLPVTLSQARKAIKAVINKG